MELMTGSNDSSANMANRGGRGGRGRGTPGRGRDGRGRGNGSSNNTNYTSNFQRQRSNTGRGRGSNNSSPRPVCQVCFKEGHTADRCWHRFEEDFVPEDRHAGAAMKSYNVDKNWYTDTVTPQAFNYRH
jgi:hypothetical protein